MKRFEIVLSVVLLAGVLASCSKGGESEVIRDIPKVPADAAYYTSASLSLGDEYIDDEEHFFKSVTPIWYSDKNIWISICLDDERYLEKYDMNGTRISKTDVKALSSGQDYSMSFMMFGEADSAYLITVEEDYGNKKSVNTLYSLSNDDKLTGIGAIDIEEAGRITTVNKAVIAGDEVFLSYSYLKDDVFNGGIAVMGKDGKCTYSKDIDGSISDMGKNADGDIVFSFMGKDGRIGFKRFCMKDHKTEDITLDDKILQKYMHGNIGSDGNLYVRRGTKILRYDLMSKTETEYLDINYCDADLVTVELGFMDRIESGRLILLDQSAPRNGVFGRCRMTILNKVSDNPYSGREILEVAEIFGADKVLAEGVRRFNSGSSERFAYVTDKYDVNVAQIPNMYADIVTNDDLTYISNQLMQDIRNGEGPDLVYGLGDLAQINSGTYLRDLVPFMDGEKGINRGDYFENAFKASMTGDKQYQIPLLILLNGIMTSSDNAPADGKGFTYDEYLNFVSDVCNGKDPILDQGLTRSEMFNMMFAAVQDEFFDQENGVAINNDKFKGLAEYIREYVPESTEYNSNPSKKASYTMLYETYYDMTSGLASRQNWDLYGIPTFDGRGPSFNTSNTVAITTCTDDENISWELIRTLLSEDVQMKNDIGNPVNLNAFDKLSAAAIEDANVTLQNMGTNARLLDQSDIDRYKKMLMKAECPSFVDTELISIFDEEMEPYFKGDKSIDEVINIIENRCKTVLSERK